MIKKLLFAAFAFSLFLFLLESISGKESFVTIINPVRGEDFGMSLEAAPLRPNFSNNFSIYLFLLLIFVFLVSQIKLPIWSWLVIFLSLAIFVVPMVKSGMIQGWGMGFWGPNGHDGVWHLSLMNQIKVPPDNPLLSGTKLFGYHWGFDFLASAIVRLFSFNHYDVYFRLLPILIGVLIGILSLKLGKKITGSYQVGILFLLLNFFCGSFGWLFTLIKSGSIGGESLFWSMQSISTLINPPFALSIVGLLFGLIVWFDCRPFWGFDF